MGSCKNCIETCEPAGAGQMVQLGGGVERLVALAGNPNTGKSTIFNHLTGLRQHTGNWPGKTVARAEGTFSYEGQRFKLVDLPGTYSLLAESTDEEIARDFVLFGQPDCTVVVCDATVLERNLLLVLQILEITNRAVVCVNLIDEAARKGLALEAESLEADLGVPVVLTAARRGRGITGLMKRVAEVASGGFDARPQSTPLDPELESAVETLAGKLAGEFPNLSCLRWVALRLLDGDEHVERALLNGELRTLSRDAGAPTLDGEAA
jgi:Fe2+ transport system protein B